MIFAFIIDSVPFTKAVRDGQTSLGGSESACLGLARALATRHEVHIFTTKLADDAEGLDAHRCAWHPIGVFAPMNEFIEWDVVVALRWFSFFGFTPVQARLRLLWNQDLLVPGDMVSGVMSVAWAADHFCYVSDYHQRQWEDLEPALAGHGWVTRNGFSPADLPAVSYKDPTRIIHISRPERGLRPLLTMWPALRAKYPHATLQICRYSSMYDQGPGSWSDTCAVYDQAVQQLAADVGGIEYLGELNKPQLYQAISNAAVMWYPGVSTFAETSCIAATEAQACGTPFVGSLKGALLETAKPSYDAGLLIAGVAEGDPAYAEASIAAVGRMLDGCASSSFEYRALQKAGKRHVETYAYDVIAAEWEAQIHAWFKERCGAHTIGILRQLLHEDDHVAARHLALGIMAPYEGQSIVEDDAVHSRVREADRALAFCDKVIAGKDHTAEQYGNAAIADPLKEAEMSGRFRAVIPNFEKCTRVLDVACGNGSFAIALTKAYPNVHVHGLDYSAANIERATAGAVEAGVGDRCHFEQLTVYDFDTQQMHLDWNLFAHGMIEGKWQVGDGPWEKTPLFDGLFVGEFVEHAAACTLLVDALETVLEDGAAVVYTCPSGACAEMVPRGMELHRGHVHRFHHDDLKAVWGAKLEFNADYLAAGITERGNPLGNWLISYTVAPNRPAGVRPIEERILRTRPLQKLSVGILAKDAELDIAKCLDSVWHIADEIIVGDTGSRDDTKAIAAKFGATVLDLAPILQQPEGFAGARNQVLEACSGDWHLWIDTDEHLLDGHLLRRYLDGTPFHGYVLHQTHLFIDMTPTYDKPVRVFRMNHGIRFYGCVHEQPQMGDCNADIFPSLEPFDVKLAHIGYLTERTRAEKRVSRNLPLLLRDQQVFGDRVLGQVLRLREYVIQADAFCADARGLTEKARLGYLQAIGIFIRSFDDPTHKYHELSRPWYEAALKHLGMGYEFEMSLMGRQGGLESTHAQRAERIWVRDVQEAERLMAWKMDGLKKAMAPIVFHTDPFVLPASQREAVSA